MSAKKKGLSQGVRNTPGAVAGPDLSQVIADLRQFELENQLPLIPVQVQQVGPVPNPQDTSERRRMGTRQPVHHRSRLQRQEADLLQHRQPQRFRSHHDLTGTTSAGVGLTQESTLQVADNRGPVSGSSVGLNITVQPPPGKATMAALHFLFPAARLWRIG